MPNDVQLDLPHRPRGAARLAERDAKRGRGLAQAGLALVAVLAYLLVQAVMPDDLWTKARPVAALGLGATLLGLAVDAARSVTGVGDPLSSNQRRHEQRVARVTDAEFDRADTAVRDFVEDGTLTTAYTELFAHAPDPGARDELLGRAREIASARPSGRRPLLGAMGSGAVLVGTGVLVALTLFPSGVAETAAMLTLAAGVYALQVRAVTARSRAAVVAAGVIGTLLMHAVLTNLFDTGFIPGGLHPILIMDAVLLGITALVAGTMGRRSAGGWEATRRGLVDDTRRSRRRTLIALTIGLVFLVAKNPVEGAFQAIDINVAPMTSSVLIALWGVAAYTMVELGAAHWALYRVTRRSRTLRRRRLDVHTGLFELTVGPDRAARERPAPRSRTTPLPRTPA